ncbi:TlpA family protein disulfide reductase [Desulfonatronovibrio hydrogenovorans]|uniref:TlpA family protein disulfide reductase n=1 Tax=Desulfonatronovibrio hydrogenovorans TaxID=53245 RepID=UPI00068B6FFE|nr:TlpA disulfide reductase family protein [Desulfonatronovibrio hydrogenovorans]
MKNLFFTLTLFLLFIMPVQPVQAQDIPTVNPQDIEEVIRQEQGRVLLLNFWATWCAPCRAEIRELVKIREAYSPDDLSIIGLSLDFDPGMIPAFMERMDMNYPVMHATDQVMSSMEIDSIPYTQIFKRDGNLAHEFFELVETEILLEIIDELTRE